jgi:hypothetical protein
LLVEITAEQQQRASSVQPATLGFREGRKELSAIGPELILEAGMCVRGTVIDVLPSSTLRALQDVDGGPKVPTPLLLRARKQLQMEPLLQL